MAEPRRTVNKDPLDCEQGTTVAGSHSGLRRRFKVCAFRFRRHHIMSSVCFSSSRGRRAWPPPVLGSISSSFVSGMQPMSTTSGHTVRCVAMSSTRSLHQYVEVRIRDVLR
jgi:hypothetical protein